MFRRLASLLLVSALGTCLSAPPAQPSAPDAYHARIRLDISAYGSERVPHYRELMQALGQAGFVRDPDEVVADDEPVNPKATRLSGTLPSKGVEAVLNLRHVRSLLLYPKGAKLPEKDQRVRVDMRLPSGYLPQTQLAVARQAAAVLAKDAGFVEAVGYDRRGGARLVGSMPADQLDKLVEDVRKLPSAEAAGSPLRGISPIRLTVVRPDWPVPSAFPPAPTVPPKEVKFTPDLRALLAGGDAGKQARLEVVLGWTPEKGDRSWQRLIEQADAVVEGRVGPLVTVLGVPKDVAPRLAEMNEVAHVRLPRSGRHVVAGEAPPAWEPVKASGLVKIHAMGRKGQGSRVALVSDDFAGWEKLGGAKDQIKLVDLTAERNRDLRPDPFPTSGGEGYGTRCARALLRAAPESELTLVRIDATAPYMLQTAAQAINGEAIRTAHLDRRLTELRADREKLDREREVLVEERRRVLADPVADEEGLKRQAEYRKRRDAFEAEEKAHAGRRDRYFALFGDLQRMKGVRLVASTLVWTDGYPVDGSSALSRYFDDRPFRAALWFQAAGDTGGQAWSGAFRDEDGNGVLEFAPDRKVLPAGSWSRELNFLGWQPAKGPADRAIPANTRLRITLQWREAHDPTPLRLGDDVYREPLSKFELVVVYQPDPDGKSRPADDLDVVATTVGPPARLNQTLNSATYEHLIDLDVSKPGRYAVFVRGTLPGSIQAPGENSLPANRKTGEVRPRLFVQTLRGAGRALWADFATRQAALGMPADAHRVLAVGAADDAGKPRDASAGGSPAGLALLKKPDVLAFDLNGGSGEAASFAAGFAAAAWPLGGTLFGVLDRMHVEPGALLRVPERPVRP
ncbi:MAG: hypothetical protein U0797_19480 [Gemmataceae bacterium]